MRSRKKIWNFAVFKRQAIRIIFIPGAFFLCLILKCISLFFPFKISLLRAERLGHLSQEPDLFLRRKIQGLVDCSCLYIFISDSRNIANSYFFNLLKSYLFILNSYKLRLLIEKLKGFLEFFDLYYSISENFSFAVSYNKCSEVRTLIKLPDDDNCLGENLLFKKFGVDLKKHKIICIFGRDSQYLAQSLPYSNWSYHDHRDIDINTYIKAIEYLVNNGYKVFRLGKIVEKKVNFKHPNFIDYACSDNRSDFLDVFLIYVSCLVIGTPAGICDLATVFDKPYLGIGFVPVFSVPACTNTNSLFIPKKICYSNSQKDVPFFQLLNFKNKDEINFSDMHNLKLYGLKYVDNSEEEIYLATKEMIQKIEGSLKLTPEDQIMINYYNDVFCRNVYQDFAVKSPIAVSWLKLHEHLFFSNCI